MSDVPDTEATANIVVTKEDIVEHKINKVLIKKRAEHITVATKLGKLNVEIQVKTQAAHDDARIYVNDNMIANNPDVTAVIDALAKIEVNITAQIYDVMYEDGKAKYNLNLYNTDQNYTIVSTDQTMDLPPEICKLYDELKAMKETQMADSRKVNELANEISPAAIENMRVDYMSQLMDAAMSQLNSGLKLLLPGIDED